MLKNAWEDSHTEQIAKLLNEHNKLTTSYTKYDIRNSGNTNYYPLVFGEVVLGAVGVQRINFLRSEIKHLVVNPAFRGRGFGKMLIEIALKKVDTPLSIASIRTTNERSMKLFSKAGFEKITTVKVRDHEVCLVLRKNEVDTKSNHLLEAQLYPSAV